MNSEWCSLRLIWRSLLFTGLLINRESVTPILRWLHTVSFFHAAFEALAVNELRWLQLKEVKVCLVPVLLLLMFSQQSIVRSRARSTSRDYLICLWFTSSGEFHTPSLSCH